MTAVHESAVYGQEGFDFLDSSYVHKLMPFGTICIRSHELLDEMGDSVQLRHFRRCVTPRALLFSKKQEQPKHFWILLMTESQRWPVQDGRFFPTTWRFIFPFGHQQHHLRCKEDEETNVGLIGAGCKKRLRFGMKHVQGGVVPCEFQGGKMCFLNEDASSWMSMEVLNLKSEVLERQEHGFELYVAWQHRKSIPLLRFFEMGLITSWIDSHMYVIC